MREYGKVSSIIFIDQKSRNWDHLTFRVAIYLLAGPHTNLIGCFRLPIGYAAEDLNEPYESLLEALNRLEKDGFIRYCKATKWVFIKNFLSHNRFESPNVAKAALGVASEVPKDCAFYQEFCLRFKELGRWVWSEGKDKQIDLREGLPKPSESLPEDKPYPEPEPRTKNLEPELEHSLRSCLSPDEPTTCLQDPVSDGKIVFLASPPSDEPEQAFEIYNQTATRHGLPKAIALSATRRTSLKARLRECGGLEGWKAAMAKLAASSFCQGKNRDGWIADLDFLLQKKSFIRLMEGRYDDRDPKERISPMLAECFSAMDDIAAGKPLGPWETEEALQ